MTEALLPATTGAQVRDRLVRALRLDLVGPEDGSPELLPDPASDRYLTGYLVPLGFYGRGPSEDKAELPLLEATEGDDGDAVDELGGAEPTPSPSERSPDAGPRRPGRLPNSLGLTVMLPREVTTLAVEASWGDYAFHTPETGPEALEGEAAQPEGYRRTPRLKAVSISLKQDGELALEASGSMGMKLRWVVRPYVQHLQVVSLFLVNGRKPVAKEFRLKDPRGDGAEAFQAALKVLAPQEGFAPRPNHGLEGSADDELAELELRFRDRREWAVGHGVGVRDLPGSHHWPDAVSTDWLPEGQVQRVVPAEAHQVGLAPEALHMEALAQCPDGAAIQAMLQPLVVAFGDWVVKQSQMRLQTHDRGSTDERQEALTRLVQRMKRAVARLEEGLKVLAQEPDAALAFRLANEAMALAQRQRQKASGVPLEKVRTPAWRPFQLAFFLQALPGLAQPEHPDRDLVDLLYFPTGGGKTEAYLGLAAFAMVHRRLKHPGMAGGGMAVLMRYTLRLLTLDQVGRALQLVMALELLRQGGREARLGTWPFEVGIWLGEAATPNRLGFKGDGREDTARTRTFDFIKDPKGPAPIPLTACPWCNASLEQKPEAYRLSPQGDHPKRLQIHCQGPGCAFGGQQAMPLVSVDEELYRRLPAFVIGTVDKFANLPWLEGAGKLFGHVTSYDADGYLSLSEGTGTALPEGLPGPELIIQDELHLISGPLGTMVGLYEAGVEALSERKLPNGKALRPKIVASTATVRRAGSQIQALYGRSQDSGWALFPPLGPNPNDSFFAQSLQQPDQARRYLGVAARGVSTKVVMMRAMLALLSAAEHEAQLGGAEAADAYRTLVAYFNSLRELGGARRIVEDEVRQRLGKYGARKRLEGPAPGLANRDLRDPIELTSRVSTAQVALAKQRLGTEWGKGGKVEAVDVALATNMIATGLDVTRLGLMLVQGQPLTTAEYIQATSRVGRDPERRPGLVVTVLQVTKARDRSHLEHFSHHHAVFESLVEATSVTPFAEAALDRGLEAVAVAMARHLVPALRGAKAATRMAEQRAKAEEVAERLAERVRRIGGSEALAQSVLARVDHLLDRWHREAKGFVAENAPFQYGTELAGSSKVHALLRGPMDAENEAFQPGAQVVANRSLRDVEGSSPVRLLRMNNRRLLEDGQDG